MRTVEEWWLWEWIENTNKTSAEIYSALPEKTLIRPSGWLGL